MDKRPEDQARHLMRKGRLLYEKACGSREDLTCAQGFALHQLRLGNISLIREFLLELESRQAEGQDDGRRAMTARLIARIRGELARRDVPLPAVAGQVEDEVMDESDAGTLDG